MMHRSLHSMISRTAPLSAVLLAGVMLAGCADDPPPPPVAAKPVEAPPPPPPLTSIADLMLQYDIDRRVNLPEDRAPDTDVKRIAVLKFFDAFARGNADALRPMLSGPDQLALDGMIEGEVFTKSSSAITRIDVRCGPHDADDCALAVFHVGEEFEPQLWVYTSADKVEFDSVATPPGIMEKLSGDNWIAAWFEILKLELAKADEPDAVIAVPQTDFTNEDEAKPVETATGVSGGGNGPGRRKPSGEPVRPARPPGFGRP